MNVDNKSGVFTAFELTDENREPHDSTKGSIKGVSVTQVDSNAAPVKSKARKLFRIAGIVSACALGLLTHAAIPVVQLGSVSGVVVGAAALTGGVVWLCVSNPLGLTLAGVGKGTVVVGGVALTIVGLGCVLALCGLFTLSAGVGGGGITWGPFVFCRNGDVKCGPFVFH